MERKQKIAILGSTGSIGTQALDVISRHEDCFEAALLTANNNSALLIEQAKRFRPHSVVICNENLYKEVSEALKPAGIKVFSGLQAVCDILSCDYSIDIVLTAMVGFSGLEPTIAAITSGKTIALANKETLVAAGSLIMALSREYGAPIVPVDSEHSAIFQCLQGETATLEKILLTGSGGPFLNTSAEDLAKVTVKQALNHPRWKMGPKVTIDSASLMNKGLELIEARWLFNVLPGDIEVVVHPQSIIHSMVQFSDGTVKAQMSSPDMRVPIQYAFSYPERISLNTSRLNFSDLGQLTFFKPDIRRFPCLGIAGYALRKGGNATCIMNGANEVAVKAFLEEKIRFTDIPEIISETMIRCNHISNPTVEDIFNTDAEAKRTAAEAIKSLKGPGSK